MHVELGMSIELYRTTPMVWVTLSTDELLRVYIIEDVDQ